MRHHHSAIWLQLMLLGVSCSAAATITACPKTAYEQYHYGQKASMRFDVRRLGPGSITTEVMRFATDNGLSYGAAGYQDPAANPPRDELSHILQDTSVAIAITISTSNRSTIAYAKIETFSFSCGPVTKDWRPYWDAFLEFVRANGYVPASD